MRKAMFLAGVAVGFVAGARSGRETYDKMVAYARQVAEHPKVQQATSTVQAKTTELGKQAAAKAPEYAKGAASTISAQVPKFVQNVRQTATDRIPSRWAGAVTDKIPSRWAGPGTADPATDGKTGGQPDDVGPDGNLVYPADDASAATASRGHVTPDTP